MRFLLLSAAVCIPICLAAAQTTRPSSITIQDVRIVDGTGASAIDHGSIVIRDGKIISAGKTVRPAGTVMKLRGKTVIPGLINAHGHVGLVKGTSVAPSNYTGLNIMHELVQYEQFGVTTVMSLGLNRDLLYNIRREQGVGNEPGATVLTAGRGLGAPHGAPAVNAASDQIYRPKSAEEARQDVRAMAAEAPNLIKIWIDDNMGKLPKLAPDIYAAAIDEAHRNNLRVAAHVYYLADAKRLLADGVDILAHSVRDKELDAETVSDIKNKGVYYLPTLELEESFYIFGQDPAFLRSPFFQRAVSPALEKHLRAEDEKTAPAHRAALGVAMANLRKLNTATALIGMGTDSGANPYRIPGWAEHRELELMVEAGMTPMQAIHAATAVNAAALGVSDKVGTITAGKQADLLILDADPTEQISNTQKIAMVFHNGRQVQLEKSAAE